jgi:DNA-binding response OmpR family regulator
MPQQILVVDDDALLRRSLSFSLERAGYRVKTAANAEDGLASARCDPPDLVLLDIGLPGMDGLVALREFRALGDLPVLFLTARRTNLDEIGGLAADADDYIVKPFNPGVLLERIKVALRHYARLPASSPQANRLCVGDLTIDADTRIVTVAGRAVQLPPRVFDLLYTLALRPGQVLSAEELLAGVWGAEFQGQTQVLYVHIRWLREELETDPSQPQRVITLHRTGYKLVPQGT